MLAAKVAQRTSIDKGQRHPEKATVHMPWLAEYSLWQRAHQVQEGLTGPRDRLTLRKPPQAHRTRRTEMLMDDSVPCWQG